MKVTTVIALNPNPYRSQTEIWRMDSRVYFLVPASDFTCLEMAGQPYIRLALLEKDIVR
jgi:hypothetical protein